MPMLPGKKTQLAGMQAKSSIAEAEQGATPDGGGEHPSPSAAELNELCRLAACTSGTPMAALVFFNAAPPSVRAAFGFEGHDLANVESLCEFALSAGDVL